MALRECCNVMCKCSGHEGVEGPRGPLGTKVSHLIIYGYVCAPCKNTRTFCKIACLLLLDRAFLDIEDILDFLE